jgi:predicted permease
LIIVEVFGTVILPIVGIVVIGMGLQRWKPAPVQSLSQAVLYVFAPALVFTGLATTELPIQHMGKIVAFAFLLTAIMYVIARTASWGLKLERDAQGAFLLSVLFMNAGNLGLSVVLLAFGQEGLERSLIFFATQAMLSSTVGVYLASRGSSGAKASLISVARMPLPYAAGLGLAFNLLGVTGPEPLMQATSLLAAATIPGMLLVLGLQLVSQKGIEEWRAVGVSAVLRLVVSAGLAYGLLALLGLDDLSRKALLVQAAAPSAVLTTILAVEFNARPALATSAVLVSTVASLGTLTVLVALLTR